MPVPSAAAQQHTTNAQVREVQVQFAGVNGVTMQGTLALPGGSTHAPAVLLVPGSGPTDRNGNQADHQTDLLRQLAAYLGENGVATLRFDKRGIGGRSAMPEDPADQQAFLKWSNFAGDVASAYRTLASRPEIDRSRVAIFGHSEGGLLAIAATGLLGSAQAPAALILASTPGRTPDLVLREQLEQLMEHRGTPPAQAAKLLAEEDRITESLKKSEVLPPDVPPGLAPLFPANLTEYWHEELGFDPAAAVARYKGPVLVLQGGSDQRVSPERDATLLGKALAGRHNDAHRLVVIEGVGHALTLVGQGPEAHPTIAPAVLTTIGPWIDQVLMVR